MKGNYWEKYNGTDENSDGIGDVPFNITTDGKIQDIYPLLNEKILSDFSGFISNYEINNDATDGENDFQKNNASDTPGFEFIIFLLAIGLFIATKFKKKG